ncbi:hypothetical protein T01_10271 [Trichinella spiralis]|uniref:Uncharacterized protein n=1 Tax=Trichinella spiralis TaxID=6334 RepID=A0A0V1B417_TRISP|nr:hypothetical protein T01_10271 [Trichinella spiralis]
MKLMISHLHLKTQECKMDVNDKKTAVSLRMDQTRKNGKEQDKTRQKRNLYLITFTCQDPFLIQLSNSPDWVN